MTALDELRCGEIGDEFLALLQRTIRAVARRSELPSPRWS